MKFIQKKNYIYVPAIPLILLLFFISFQKILYTRIVSIGFPCSTFERGENYSDKEVKTVLNRIKKAWPPGYEIINSTRKFSKKYCKKETKFFMIYIRRGIDKIWQYPTLLHETCHNFSGHIYYDTKGKYSKEYSKSDWPSFSLNSEYISVYTVKKGLIDVPITDNFPARELVQVIPKNLITNRYSTYIDSKQKNISTQVEGIYGLLDEFHAYYHDIALEVNLKIMDNSSRETDTFLSFLEFKYYILEYLVKAKKDHPKIYDKIIHNKKFNTAFVLIHDDFKKFFSIAQRKKYYNKDKIKSFNKHLSKKRYITMFNVIKNSQ